MPTGIEPPSFCSQQSLGALTDRKVRGKCLQAPSGPRFREPEAAPSAASALGMAQFRSAVPCPLLTIASLCLLARVRIHMALLFLSLLLLLLLLLLV